MPRSQNLEQNLDMKASFFEIQCVKMHHHMPMLIRRWRDGLAVL
jgi:hypothetical protein